MDTLSSLERMFEKPLSATAKKKFDKGIILIKEALELENEAQNVLKTLIIRCAENDQGFREKLESLGFDSKCNKIKP